MRIAWVTPFHTKPAVAWVTHHVASELVRRGFDIEIVRGEVDTALADDVIPTEIKVHKLADLNIGVVKRDYDLVTVTLADHYQFAGGSLQLLRELPCVCVIHDADLSHLVNGLENRTSNPHVFKA